MPLETAINTTPQGSVVLWLPEKTVTPADFSSTDFSSTDFKTT